MNYPMSAATKRDLNVTDRNTTLSDRKSPADALASRFATDTFLRSVTYCHVSFRSSRFTTF